MSINQKDGSSKQVGSRTDGDSFGEMALLYNAGRTATITATRDCDLWAVRPPPRLGIQRRKSWRIGRGFARL